MSVCLYLNLKQGDLDHLATTAGYLTHLKKKDFQAGTKRSIRQLQIFSNLT